MRPQDKLKLTIQAEARRSSSDFEDIIHRGLTKRAKVEYGDFRKTTISALEERELSDDISFLNAEIAFVSKGDEIIFNSLVYEVAYYSLVMNGIYNIFATKKLRTGSRK